MQNESDRFDARSLLLLAALVLAAPHALAATPAAKSAPQPAKKPDAKSSKEPDEFKPSESLSEDATVAYPSDI